MATIKGYKIAHQLTGHGSFLIGLTTYRGENTRLTLPPRIRRGALKTTTKQDLHKSVKSYIVPNYYKTLYSRVYVIPHIVNLGAMSTEQIFDVQVWNANRYAVNLTLVQAQNAEGVELTGAQTPVKLHSLALKKWTAKVSMNGPAVIDALVLWHFVNHPAVTLNITGSRSTEWAFFPDWSENVVENLYFLTTVHQSITGAEQRIAKRLSPRRTFEFKVTTEGVHRQVFENMLYAYGSRVWSMPIFTDCATLLQHVAPGDSEIQIHTAGYDFSVKGQVLLMNGQTKESVEISGVEVNKLILKRPAVNHFDAVNTKVYPIRSAVLTDMPTVTRLSDGVSSAQVRLQIHEHNAHSADITHLPTYRNHPVLEPTSEWSEDITAQYLRLIQTLDNETGLPFYLDTARKAFQITSHRFVLANREEQRKLRQLFYYLRGRQRAIWVATSATDITLKSDISTKTFDIYFMHYTAILKNQVGRQDIRIECTDGSVHYRRIVTSSVVDEQTERLSFDGEELRIKQEEIAKISFLTLSRLESDQVTWTHHTDADGVATVTVSFRGLRDELEV
ncbi:phage tail protein [Pasteurella multocida]|uniref:phage tail protein n=1 Tax=Pasteurella multocida TaxID=747 RepID=UPI0009F3DD39|nr:phage tail protein [Pasteurella multocida]PNM03665.1 phage tail protein [Pasteurella multocida]